MAADSQKLQDKLQEVVKALTAGRGSRDEITSALTEAVERLNALEVSNKRLREEAKGPAQIAWTKFMSDAIQGYLGHEMIALEFTESQWQAVYDNCEDIADAALIRWKLRWMDGISPVKRLRKGAERASAQPEPARAAAVADAGDLDHLFEPAPRQGGPRMVAAEVTPPKPATAPVPEERPPAEPPLPALPAPAPVSKPEPPPPRPPPPPPPSSKERQPGDD